MKALVTRDYAIASTQSFQAEVPPAFPSTQSFQAEVPQVLASTQVISGGSSPGTGEDSVIAAYSGTLEYSFISATEVLQVLSHSK